MIHIRMDINIKKIKWHARKKLYESSKMQKREEKRQGGLLNNGRVFALYSVFLYVCLGVGVLNFYFMFICGKLSCTWCLVIVYLLVIGEIILLYPIFYKNTYKFKLCCVFTICFTCVF